MTTTAKPKRRRVKFTMEGNEESQVFVAGSFNDWSPTKNRLKFKEGRFSTSVLLPKGRHEYKFVVDGDWCIDPQCAEWSTNDHGSMNSVVTVD